MTPRKGFLIGMSSRDRPGSSLHRLCKRDPRKNQADTLHPIIFPAISNSNVRLARKMQSGVRKRVGGRLLIDKGAPLI